MLSIEDRHEIHDLYVRYTHAIDRGDGEAWADCFTADGYLALPYRHQHTQGRSALVEVCHAYIRRGGGYERHVTTNVHVEGDEHRAQGTAYLFLVRGGEGGTPPRMLMSGVYDDRLVCTAAGWRFESRTISVDVHPPG